MNLNLRLDRPKVIWRQVADQVRAKILSGELSEGAKLPSTTRLAAQTGTDVKTVHRALSELVREGLITRTRKIGTHVSKREAAMSTIGIYYATNIQNARHSLFLQSLSSELQTQAHLANLKTRVWMDFRPSHEQHTVLPEIEKATREREIQGLIMTIADPSHTKWLSKLRVPVACLGGFMPTSVHWDIEEFVKLSVRELRRQGCRSAGSISPYDKTHKEFHETFVSECLANGIATDDKWIVAPNPIDYFPEENFEEFGYNSFANIWSNQSKPQGMVIYPDGLARGVIMSVITNHVQIPRDLKLILHKNEGVNLFCPVPATLIISSVKEACITLLERLDDAYHGRPTSKTDLHYQVERKATGQARPAPETLVGRTKADADNT